MSEDPVVIASAARTPMGGFQGVFADVTAANLGAHAISAAVQRAGIEPALVQEVLMGCVLQAGQGQAPARQAALQAHLPVSVGCTTIHKVCGSAMKSVMLAHDSIVSGSYDYVVAGGMESMSQAPYLLPRARKGYRLGHAQVIDHMFMDGLEDAYSEESRGKLMGTFAEQCASTHGFTRQAQDDYAVLSTKRAQQASELGYFDWEICPVTTKTRTGEHVVSKDQGPYDVNIDKIATLKPAFKKDGTVTAANSSSISDGAAALLLMKASKAKALGVVPIAKIVKHVNYAAEPALFPTAPIGAIKGLMHATGWSLTEVDLFEINEAFAVVAMACMKELGLSEERVNVHGGACALGHPIGASGARIVVTLLGALRRLKLKRGVATLCIGGGEATALGIEML